MDLPFSSRPRKFEKNIKVRAMCCLKAIELHPSITRGQPVQEQAKEICSGSRRSDSSLELKKIMINLTLWARLKKAGYLTSLYLNFRNKKDINDTTIFSQQR